MSVSIWNRINKPLVSLLMFREQSKRSQRFHSSPKCYTI